MITPEYIRKMFHSAATISNNWSKEAAERKLLRRKNSMEIQQSQTRKLRIQEKQELNSPVHFNGMQNQNQWKKTLRRVLYVLAYQFSSAWD